MIETINYPSIVKARKSHICNWCGCEISKGEEYNSAVFKFDGEIYSWKNHLKCGELVNKLNMKGDYGVTDNDFHEYIEEEFKEIWRELDKEYYKSEKFVMPSFKEQVKFVYENRCA